MVKVLLLRFIRGQLDEASLRAALKAQRTSKLSKKKAKLKADKIVKALTAYLEATDGATSTSSFEGAVEALAEVATAEELEALIDHFHGKLRAQRLSEAEMIAVRLYTGPGYVKMNGSLRSASGKMPEGMTAHLKGNTYTNSIYLCGSGMKKISRAGRIPRGRKVYRGMAGFRLPDLFVHAGEDGGRGGTEFAFMSTTTNKSVAVSYINTEKGLPILFEFEVGCIDRGAPLSFLSQYPGEDEILIPPLSFLEITGEPSTMDTDKGQQVTVYPARINCNLKGQTMEEIEERRRTDLLAQEPYLIAEFQRDVPPVLETLMGYRHRDEVVLMSLPASDDLSAMAQYIKEWEELKSRGTAWFNNDKNYLEAVTKAYRSKHKQLTKAVRLTFEEDPNTHRPALFAVVEAEGKARTETQMKDLADLIKKLTSVVGAAVDETDEEGTTAAQFAAERGCAKALAALADAGADLRLARRDGATALGLAVAASLSPTTSAAALRLILERTSPAMLELVKRDAVGRPSVEDGLARMRHPVLHLLARAFMSPAALAERLGRISPAGIKGEISALLSTDLSDAVKAGLSKVRSFVDRHSSLLASRDAGLPRGDTRVWQLASQEPDDVFGAHADVVAAAKAAGYEPLLVQWLNKAQTPHPCRLTIAGESAVRCVTYSKCGTRMARAEGFFVIVSDAETFFELCRFVGHTAAVTCVAFNPGDRDELASGSEDKSLRLFSLKTRSCTRTMTGHRCLRCLILCLLFCFGFCL